tara:strand:+ start:1961 stop:2389 length:429 start_codon:yes stop_codon:yes gene_type:complete
MNVKDQIKKIKFPIIKDSRGNLSFFESGSSIPFKIKRVFWIYDVPAGETRGSHANKKINEVIIALSGSFDVIIKDHNDQKKSYNLSHPSEGLYLPQLTWRGIENFSTNSVCLIVASTLYNQQDYITQFSKFKKLRKEYEQAR